MSQTTAIELTLILFCDLCIILCFCFPIALNVIAGLLMQRNVKTAAMNHTVRCFMLNTFLMFHCKRRIVTIFTFFIFFCLIIAFLLIVYADFVARNIPVSQCF